MVIAERSAPVASPAPPQARKYSRWRSWTTLGSALLVLAAVALRFYAISSQSLWYDEGVSAGMVGQGPATIIREAAADFHPPLYYLLLACWARLFGDSVVALRGLSAVAGVLAALMTWRIATRLFGAVTGGLAALWATVAPLGVMFSQELRMYMPVAAAVSVAGWCAVVWLEAADENSGGSRQTTRWAWPYLMGYVLAAAIALYLQYVAGLGLAAIGLYGLLRARGLALWRWLAANAIALLLFAPWLPVFHHQLTVGHTGTTPQTSARDVLTASLGSLLVGTDGVPAANHAAVTLLGAFVLLGAVRAARRWRHGALPLLLVIVPLIGVVAYAAWKSVYEVRYILVALPGIAVLGGLGLRRTGDLAAVSARRVGGIAAIVTIRRGVTLLATLALVAAAGAADIRYYVAPVHPHDNYRGLAATITRESQPGDGILLYPPGQNHVFGYYYRGPDSVVSLPLQRPPNVADVTASLTALFRSHPRVWVVEYGAAEADPNGIIANWLGQHAFLAGHQWFGSPQLLLYAAGPAATTETAIASRLDNGAELLFYNVAQRAVPAGGTVEITLTWRDDHPINQRYTVFTHVLDAQNHVVAQHDGEPAAGTRPTTTWRPGTTIEDRHAIVLPATLAPGVYQIEIGMYLPASGARAQVVDSAGRATANRILLGQITVTRGAQA